MGVKSTSADDNTVGGCSAVPSTLVYVGITPLKLSPLPSHRVKAEQTWQLYSLIHYRDQSYSISMSPEGIFNERRRRSGRAYQSPCVLHPVNDRVLAEQTWQLYSLTDYRHYSYSISISSKGILMNGRRRIGTADRTADQSPCGLLEPTHRVLAHQT